MVKELALAAIILLWAIATAVIAMELSGGEANQQKQEKWSGYPARK